MTTHYSCFITAPFVKGVRKAISYPCRGVFMLDVLSRGLGYLPCDFNRIIYIYFAGHEHMLYSTTWVFLVHKHITFLGNPCPCWLVASYRLANL